jgi:antitoxin component YwqK of YwqJK toxin-antitoxin module
MANKITASLLLAVAIGIGVFLASRPEAPTETETVRVPRSSVELKDEGLCLKTGGGPFTGVMFDQSEGKLLAEIPVKNGLVHGVARGWHDNGQLEVEEPFEDGYSHGLRTRWHPNGQKRSEANIKQGKLEGLFTEWNPDGSLKSSLTLHNGQPLAAEMAVSH